MGISGLFKKSLALIVTVGLRWVWGLVFYGNKVNMGSAVISAS